jgi:adenylate cyclase
MPQLAYLDNVHISVFRNLKSRGLWMGQTEHTLHSTSRLATLPDYQVTIKLSRHRIKAVFQDTVIADSTSVLILRETRHAPTYYFPKNDVSMEYLIPSVRSTYCPFKGNASYWSLQVRDKIVENCAWTYHNPHQEVTEIEGYIAFYPDKLDAWYEDHTLISGTSNTQQDEKTNPFVGWLLSEAWEAATPSELTHRLVGQLNEQGMQIHHLCVVVHTLHPLLAAYAYRWSRSDGEITKIEASYDSLDKDAYIKSPLAQIFDGLGGLRRWIDAESAQEYAAMPMRFSDGQLNAVTMATGAANGFSTKDLGFFHEILPLLSRLFEIHAKQDAATSLMQTYLGKQTGKRVLDGKIKRGDGENINAVIWFSDLRNSTPMAESMSRSEYLDYLNMFFDDMAGSVVKHGGEILQFNGDAVLAIFPINHDPAGSPDANQALGLTCERAIKAAEATISAISKTNTKQRETGKPEITFGIGIHMGDLTYGNIGIPDRLHFTVIGSAANETARIESMTKKLGVPVLTSQQFASNYAGELKSMGLHKLRGMKNERELYTLSVK